MRTPTIATAGAERQVLRAHASQMAARVDEDGLEVGRLAALNSAAELRRDALTRFRRQRLREMVAEQLGVRPSRGSLGCFVHVHEAALDVVHARGNHEAVDQRKVDVLQGIGHGTWWTSCSQWVNQPRRRRIRLAMTTPLN
jgi:hypothetical protein